MGVSFDEGSIKKTKSEMAELRSTDETQAPTEEQQTLTTEQEYELWKKNCHYMYDFVYEFNLGWPSLTCQWLPNAYVNDETNGIDASLLAGTNTSGSEDEHLEIVGINIPKYVSSKFDAIDADTENANANGNKSQSRNRILRKFDHYESEVNRSRYMPQNPSIFATISGEGTAYVYANAEDKKLNRAPVLTLQYHKENGFGLDWSPHQQGKLLTAADDRTICLWDVNAKAIKVNQQIKNKTIEPVSILHNHSDIVNDVKWHKFNENLFGSVSDDKSLLIFDTRDLGKPALTKANIHNEPVNTLAFSPFSKNLLATGSSDSTVGLFDIRNLDHKLHSMMGHSEKVTTMEWSPHTDGFLATGSEDRRVIIWDISKIGEEQSQDDADDGAPELFMMHAGHTDFISDLSWHPDDTFKWLVASTADNNVIQLWKPNKNLTDPVDGWKTDEVYEDLE